MNKSIHSETVKEKELLMLRTLLDCCNALNIRCYLIGGTALGAIRHSGFIPWDDDIDIGLMRSDYELFVEKAQKMLPDYYFIQTRKTDREYLYSYAKMRDSRTTFIESSQKHLKINHGVFIDVFPLDYYPTNKREQKIIERKSRLLSLRIRKEFPNDIYNRERTFRRLLQKIILWLLTMKYPNVDVAIEKRELLYKNNKKSDLIVNYNGAWGDKEIIPSKWLGKGKTISFEGISAIVPENYDAYLSHFYGDYMSLPPLKDRHSHHYTDIIDMENPYTSYL